MTYARVIPRDLFNEGDLLNCLGRLWIKLDERRDHAARLTHYQALGPFDVKQEEADGSIYVENVLLIVGEFQRPMFRPLNTREKWPLWARFDDEDVRVFGPGGELSPEFWALIRATGTTDSPPCQCPGDDEFGHAVGCPRGESDRLARREHHS